MLEYTHEVVNNGKKSLERLLRVKAFDEVADELQQRGIEINDVADDDIEVLVQAKVNDMHNGIKGFAVGSIFAVALSAMLGI